MCRAISVGRLYLAPPANRIPHTRDLNSTVRFARDLLNVTRTPALSPTDFMSSVSQTTISWLVGDRVRIFTKCLSRVVPTPASTASFFLLRRAELLHFFTFSCVEFCFPFSCVELYLCFPDCVAFSAFCLVGRYSTAPLPPRVAHSLLRSPASGSAPPY